MEFGIFVQGHAPGQAKAHSPVYEQDWVRRELELIRVADKCNWKYVWVTEHHFLEEYSHLSDSATFIAYALAQTEQIHIGSGIFNMNPIVNHPLRLAERVAMLDQLSEGRFEFGTGRGAGSHEIGGFSLQHSDTRANWEETLRQIPKMWRQKGYSYPDGKAFSVPTFGTQMMPDREGAFNVVPKPYAHTHPALWVAAGSPGTYERAAKRGLGLLGFNVGSVWDMSPLIKTYKEHIRNAEPIGEYVNDNVMVTVGMVCLEDRQKAREYACSPGGSYLASLVFRYHDSFPRPDGIPQWPKLIPDPSLEDLDARIEHGYALCGNPEEVIKQIAPYQEIGCDQLVFGVPGNLPHDVVLESIRVFGEQVIPKFDTEPKHSTTRFREAAGGPLVPRESTS
ncbi:MAG: LLM class flavin-dependent oxidoreductase [Dehalococcoidia bacterium]